MCQISQQGWVKETRNYLEGNPLWYKRERIFNRFRQLCVESGGGGIWFQGGLGKNLARRSNITRLEKGGSVWRSIYCQRLVSVEGEMAWGAEFWGPVARTLATWTAWQAGKLGLWHATKSHCVPSNLQYGLSWEQVDKGHPCLPSQKLAIHPAPWNFFLDVQKLFFPLQNL